MNHWARRSLHRARPNASLCELVSKKRKGKEMPMLISEYQAAKLMGIATKTLREMEGIPRIVLSKQRKYRVCDIESHLAQLAKASTEKKED